MKAVFSGVLLVVFLVTGAAAQEHAGHYSQADWERGLRIYGQQCVVCHGVDGELVAGVDLRTGKFRHASSDEEIQHVVLAGIPGTAMPPHKFDNQELTAIVAYIRGMRDHPGEGVALGDAARGQALFQGKGGCLNCHRVGAQGSRLAPDLSEIGGSRLPAALQKSLLDPTASMLPKNRSVRAVTRDGRVITGRRLNEDTYSVQLIDTGEHLVSLLKANLREYTVLPDSPMPSFRDRLTSQELADVLAYLLTLKGAN